MKKSFKNPIYQGADPFILLYENKYYAYTSGGDDGNKVMISDNLIDWEDKGFCLKKEDVIGNYWFWAPEVIYRNGMFYMAFTAERHLGIAVSESPLGPFVQKEKKWCVPHQAIDGHFFVDDDGKVYLFYAAVSVIDGIEANRIYGAEMNEQMTEIKADTEKLIISPELPWEKMNDGTHGVEGPFVLKHGSEYHISYSTNGFESPDYCISGAVSNSPLGEYKKYEKNPVLKRNEYVQGVGHHSFTTSKDGKELICAYHIHNNKENVEPRLVCIDKAEFVDGVLKINGPTMEVQVFDDEK